MSHNDPDSPDAVTPDRAARHDAVYDQLSTTAEFRDLRRRYRQFVVPASLAFLGWYALYIVLAMFAPGLMNTSVLGHINVALVIGLLQFVTTFAIAFAYARYSNRRLDPLASDLNDAYVSARTGGTH